jgi:hypothetical protein
MTTLGRQRYSDGAIKSPSSNSPGSPAPVTAEVAYLPPRVVLEPPRLVAIRLLYDLYCLTILRTFSVSMATGTSDQYHSILDLAWIRIRESDDRLVSAHSQVCPILVPGVDKAITVPNHAEEPANENSGLTCNGVSIPMGMCAKLAQAMRFCADEPLTLIELSDCHTKHPLGANSRRSPRCRDSEDQEYHRHVTLQWLQNSLRHRASVGNGECLSNCKAMA